MRSTYQNHGRPVIENTGPGVEPIEMSFDGTWVDHVSHRKFMMIKEKYNINEDVDTYQSLSHKVMFMQMNAEKGIQIFGERLIAAMFK